jgi:hypothetical protein
MKNSAKITIVLICFFIGISMQNADAQYQIKRSVIGNGAAHVSNASYSVHSTLGQPVIGIMSNNTYSHYTGFWYFGDLYVSIGDPMTGQIPQKYELFQNYPNPFNPMTTIQFALPEAGWVKLEVYTLLGKRVTTLLNEYKTPGVHKVNFENTSLSTGFYIYQIQAGKFRAAHKMLLTK